jgi:integrase
MICFPIMHKQTVNKVVRLAYKTQLKYGIMAELLFSCGYRMCDVINLQKKEVSNGLVCTFFFSEKKTGAKRCFNHADLPKSVIDYINALVCTDYLFPSNMYTEKGKTRPISSSRVKQVFHEIFRSIPKLRGAYGTHIFRKTFAYFEYRKGDIYRVKRKLGHKNINSTIKYLPEEIFME